MLRAGRRPTSLQAKGSGSSSIFWCAKKILLVEARRSGLAREPSYRKAIQAFKQRWKQQFREYQDTLLVRSYLNRLRSKELAVSDEDVRRYYEAHAEEYLKPLQVQASHILVGTENDAQKVLNRLQSGESFEQVARQSSKDTGTAATGGRLAAFRRGDLVPEFEEAVFKLAAGQTSGVVKTPFGYHIIRKTGQSQLPPETFDEVKEKIRARLERDRFEQWVTQKQSILRVHINEQHFPEITPPAMPAGQEPPSL